jgi:hypothetical protein
LNVVVILASFHTGYGLSDAGKERVKEAARILHGDPDAKVVISGGELAYGTEGPHHEVVAAELAGKGIETSRVLSVLDSTKHTVDEAEAIANLLKTVDFQTLYVVTSFVHFPRAPFVFLHFLDFARVVFVLVTDGGAKDVTLFNYLHEAEAYQEFRRQGGLILANGNFVKTDFSYQEFTDALRSKVEIRIPGLKDFEFPETKDMNLFSHYTPNSPFGNST